MVLWCFGEGRDGSKSFFLGFDWLKSRKIERTFSGFLAVNCGMKIASSKLPFIEDSKGEDDPNANSMHG